MIDLPQFSFFYLQTNLDCVEYSNNLTSAPLINCDFQTEITKNDINPILRIPDLINWSYDPIDESHF